MVPLRKKYERTRIKSMVGAASSSEGDIFMVSGSMGRAEVAAGQEYACHDVRSARRLSRGNMT
jgi:hypothetical protein